MWTTPATRHHRRQRRCQAPHCFLALSPGRPLRRHLRNIKPPIKAPPRRNTRPPSRPHATPLYRKLGKDVHNACVKLPDVSQGNAPSVASPGHPSAWPDLPPENCPTPLARQASRVGPQQQCPPAVGPVVTQTPRQGGLDPLSRGSCCPALPRPCWLLHWPEPHRGPEVAGADFTPLLPLCPQLCLESRTPPPVRHQ